MGHQIRPLRVPGNIVVTDHFNENFIIYVFNVFVMRNLLNRLCIWQPALELEIWETQFSGSACFLIIQLIGYSIFSFSKNKKLKKYRPAKKALQCRKMCPVFVLISTRALKTGLTMNYGIIIKMHGVFVINILYFKSVETAHNHWCR